jgi:TatA/E family protein of Tat protein translocase
VDILGIGPLELVLILVIALMVFGPDKLPEIGAKMGKGVRELRQLSREITAGVNTITEPMEELRKPFDEAGQIAGQISAGAAALSNPAQALQNSLEKQLTAPSAEPAAAVSTTEDQTIAPPRAAESAAPVAALAATGSVAADPDETAAPVVQLTEEVASPAVAVEETVPVMHSSVAPAPVTAPDTLDEAAADTAADPPATESPSPATER